MNVFIGYDKREDAAYRKAQQTLHETSGVVGTKLCAERLAAVGLLRRPMDTREGKFYDIPSNAYASTEFAASRFLVPILCQSGWALFVDCDVLFHESIFGLLDYADPDKAVMVVKHQHNQTGTKMDGQPQTVYPRKNWSSVMLFNCEHPANLRLTLQDVNQRPGRDLHAFYWLHDDEIGELPDGWNWLVNVQPRPNDLCLSHYTLGGPWIPDWEPKPYDDEWLAA